jgi:hypothetical protein
MGGCVGATHAAKPGRLQCMAESGWQFNGQGQALLDMRRMAKVLLTHGHNEWARLHRPCQFVFLPSFPFRFPLPSRRH